MAIIDHNVVAIGNQVLSKSFPHAHEPDDPDGSTGKTRRWQRRFHWGCIGVDLISCTVLMDIKLARQGEPKRPLAGSSLVEMSIIRLSGLLPEPHGAKLVAAGIHKVS